MREDVEIFFVRENDEIMLRVKHSCGAESATQVSFAAPNLTGNKEQGIDADFHFSLPASAIRL